MPNFSFLLMCKEINAGNFVNAFITFDNRCFRKIVILFRNCIFCCFENMYLEIKLVHALINSNMPKNCLRRTMLADVHTL